MWRRRPASRPRPRARGGLPGLVALVALLGVAGCAREAATPEGALSLAGRQPFRAGDDPGWAAAELDDTGWARVPVPGGLDAEDLSAQGVGWYRLRFRLPAGRAARGGLAASAGWVQSAERALLNGHALGGCGALGVWGVEPSLIHLPEPTTQAETP